MMAVRRTWSLPAHRKHTITDRIHQAVHFVINAVAKPANERITCGGGVNDVHFERVYVCPCILVYDQRAFASKGYDHMLRAAL